MSRPPHAFVRAILVALLVGGFAAFAATVFARSQEGPSLLFDAGIYNVPFAAAALLGIVATGWRRAAWRTLGVGLGLFAVANAYSTIAFAGDADPPYPSLADAGWLAFYPIAYVSLLRLGGGAGGRAGRGAQLDGLIAALGTGALVGALALGPIMDATAGSFAAVATNLAYPAGDLLLLMLVVGMVATGRLLMDRSSVLLVAGFVAFAVTDAVFLFQGASGTYVEGGPLDLGWSFAAVLLGLAGASRGRAARVDAQRPASRRVAAMIWLPAIAALTSIGVLASQAVTDVPLAALAAAIVCLVLGVVRIVVTFHDLRDLAEARLEARTDELTGLANRRAAYEQITRHVSRGANASPFGVVIVDLDGFKDVNDDLGHSAGDALLAAVGARLRASASHAVTPCRLGGDEFAIVIDGDRDALRRAVSTLRECLAEPVAIDGSYVRVGASIGTARFPDDGATVDELLRAADQAMYRDKRSRQRGLPGGASRAAGR